MQHSVGVPSATQQPRSGLVLGCRPPSCSRLTRLGSTSRSGWRMVAHQKGNLGDDLLDFVTAGPKMRKWYGQGPRRTAEDEEEYEQLPAAQREPDQEPDMDATGDAVLVTDADSRIGEQLVLQLILSRANTKALVRDTAAAKSAYGPYITPVSCDINSKGGMLTRALAGCQALVCLGPVSSNLLQMAQQAGVQHLVLLSAAGSSQSSGGLFGGLFDNELRPLRDPAREDLVTRSGFRHTTVVRIASVRDAPGGQASIRLQPVAGGSSSNGATSGAVSREDLACVLVQALSQPPSSPTRVFQVLSTSPGTPPEDWSTLFDSLQPTA